MERKSNVLIKIVKEKENISLVTFPSLLEFGMVEQSLWNIIKKFQ